MRADAGLDHYYPEEWPAHVVVKWTGKHRSMLLTTPRAPQWEDVLLKSGPLLDPAQFAKKFGRVTARILSGLAVPAAGQGG